MKTLLKVLAGLVLIIIVAVVAISIIFDPNDYKPQIQELAKEKASIDLQINGDIGWSIFPTLGLQLMQVDAKTLEGEPLASLKSAQVAVNIPALLAGKVKMNGITVDGLDLTIKSSSDSAKAKEEEKDSGDSEKNELALDIGNVVLKDANIRYEDTKTGQTIIIRNFNFNGDNVSSSETFPASMKFNLEVLQDKKNTVALTTKLSTEILLDTVEQVYELIGLDMTVEIKHEALGDKPQAINLKGNLIADLKADKASVSDFVIALANLSVKTNLDILNMSKSPQFKGDITIPAFDAKALMATLNMPAIETQNDKALTAISLYTKVAGPANVLALEDLTLQLDSTEFKGQLSYNLSSGAQRIKLAGNSINVDDYLPPATDKKPEADPEKSGERYPKTPLLPVDTLKDLNINADIALSKLMASGLTIENLKLLLNAKSGLINVSKVSGDLYSGSFDNSVVIDARKTPLTMSVKKDISNIKLGGLLKDLTKQEYLRGVYNMKGAYQMEGNSIYDIVHTLDGNMSMSLKDGRIEGVNLVDKLCSGIMTLKGKKPDPSAAVSYTEFSNLSTSADIVNGLVTNKDLKAALVGVNMSGAGQVNLPAETLDYGLSLTVLQELTGPNCQIDGKLHNISLPLRCKGGFDDAPTSMCGLDKDGMKKVLTDLGGAELKAKADAKVDAVKEKAQDKVKDKLKGLFGS